MANFERQKANIHGTAQASDPGKTFDFGLWGPWYKSDPRSGTWDLELTVSSVGGTADTALRKGKIRSDPSVREYSLVTPPAGTHTFVAKDRTGAVWSTFSLNVGAPAAAKGRRITAAQLTTPTGMGWPGWNGASPAVKALGKQLEDATSKTLSKSNSKLQGSGHGTTIDEHYSGLSIDIFLDAGNPVDRRRAHNLLRFFIAHRTELKWLHIFYENVGFSSNKPIAGEKKHFDHIHIDWFDSKLAEPRGGKRSEWIAITWPQDAMADTYILSTSGLDALRSAWEAGEGPLDLNDSVALAALYD